ncbi:hypothetical protein MRB53_029738 [Persea americana]|uniref:Uncharacterized protein n=1 Tax=Persea americana TaxID=3435 RepID=A0ACC2KJS5_PERAE|nr:hypothetical protein MRB53_029738 [Persea americana]
MEEKREKASCPAEVTMLGASNSNNNIMRAAEIILRLVPMGLCLAALLIMIKNAESNDYGSVSYDDLGGFKYLVYANGICAGYSILSAFLTGVTGASPARSTAWTVFFFDQVLTYMILAAGAVAAEVLYLANKGDKTITWSQACGLYGGFCHKATASVGITFGAVACYVVLSLISSYRLFITYDAPICFPRDVATFPG